MGTAHRAPNPHLLPAAEAPPQGRGRTDTPLSSPGEGLPHLGFMRRQTAGELVPGPPSPRDSKPLRPLPQGHQQEEQLPCLVPPAQPSLWAPGHHPGMRPRVPPPSLGRQYLSILHPLLKDPSRSWSGCPQLAPRLWEEAFQGLQVEVPGQNWGEGPFH